MEELFRKYLDNQCSPEELRTLFTYFDHPENEIKLRELVFDTLQDSYTENDDLHWQPATEKIFVSLKSQLHPGEKKVIPIYKRTWIQIAAAVVLAIGIFSIYTYFNNSETNKPVLTENKPSDSPVVSGGNKAFLTLADGSIVDLTTLSGEIVASQGNINIKKVADGQLLYLISKEKSAKTLYNNIETPKGGQYQVTLSDGTRVWLNAASTINFPVAFTGTEREVSLTGEAYFEVAENKSMPFKVKTGTTEIEVLGTHFNVNAYTDEPTVKTTLLEGKVKVTGLVMNDSRTINPGEQAQINAKGQMNVVKESGAEDVIAWKNGNFNFNNADLETTLRQIARWYDVEIVFEGTVSKKKFNGEMQRNLSITQVLRLLETNNIFCRLEGRKLIVLK